MTKFKAALALLAVFVILAAPAYAKNVPAPFTASNDAGSGFFHTVATGKNVFNFDLDEPVCFGEASGKERNT